MQKIFVPAVIELATFASTATIDELDAETSVYAASPDFVRLHCGAIANRILDAVPQSYYDTCKSLGMLPNIDVRVHRLNVGEYPAVPGWHCDGVLRETYFGAPQLDRIKIRDTVLATVSTCSDGISNFEIADEPFCASIGTNDDFKLWAEVNKQVENAVMSTKSSKDGVLYQMSIDTLHRAMPAKKRGWRLFFRMSMWHNDYLGEGGKISRQQQVYIKHESGW